MSMDIGFAIGMLLGAVIALGIPVLLIMLGRRRQITAVTVIGWVLLALVVFGMLGQAAQQST